jgi:phytoene dehydrogenase-like protein
MQTRKGTVVVIGAGVAGLSAAAWLSQQGVPVVVLEAAPQVGGCCGTTIVDGYRFNDGAQYLMLPQMLATIFEQLKIEFSSLALQRVRTPLLTESRWHASRNRIRPEGQLPARTPRHQPGRGRAGAADQALAPGAS